MIETNTGLETLARLRSALGDVMSLDSHLSHESGVFEFRGRLTAGSEEAFSRIYERFTAIGYTPALFHRDGLEVVVAQPGVARPARLDVRVNVILFAVTIVSTLLAGMLWSGSPEVESALSRGADLLAAVFNDPALLLQGLPFALTLLLILGVHEMGHYVLGRLHRAEVTPPYFIPFPPLLGMLTFGTMGAVILMRAPIKNRRQLFDIGVAGPLAGLAVAIPLLLVGLATSEVGPVPDRPYLLEGNSLLYLGIKLLMFGRILPGDGLDVSINAVAMAAWFGLFMTGLNLLPIGSLDGGHVTYAMFGRSQWKLAQVVWLIMLVGGLALSVVSGQLLNIWLFWALLVRAFGMRHPPPLDDITPLDPKRLAVGVFTMILFVLLIVPTPLSFIVP